VAYKIYAARHVDFPSECRLRYVKSDSERFKLHTHDYYEIFLTVKGRIDHVVNGKTVRLREGALVFVRDFDEHGYRIVDGAYAEFINLAFTKDTFEALSSLLGEEFSNKGFTECDTPPTVYLSPSETEYLYRRFMNLNSSGDDFKLKYEVRLLLVTVFSRYFMNGFKRDADSPPDWLESFYDEIKKPEVFTLEKLDFALLSGKSREHTVREFKKYYGTAPGEFVNSERLNFAQNLLRTSNLTVLETALESGFSNLSWFNELFRRVYGTTPLQYRLQSKQKGKIINTKPVKLTPACKNYLWGGENLKTKYNKRVDMTPLAETWELSTHPDGESVVEESGITLSEYIEKNGSAILGKRCERFDRFPILIKFIDAAKSLSVQVHPDDAYALENEGDLGKTEVWYVLEASEGAKIYYGFNREVTAEEVRLRIADGTLCDVLGCYDSKKGDVFFIPSGTVHAIGEGNIICEVQENSNTTYRFFDYNRRDKDGNLRPLHIDKALRVTNLSPTALKEPEGDIIAECEYFKSVVVKGTSKTSVNPDSFTSVVVLEGEGCLKAGENTLDFKKGESVFIPAGYSEISFEGDFEIILTQI
jgi:mannose-6-phosphate isomerase